MPEIIFSGPEGRLEGRYHHAPRPDAPIVLILHPCPLQGGTMHNRIVYSLYQIFAKKGFSALRFNFRGVGRSQGTYDSGIGELSDAASALDWLQAYNPNSSGCWVAGFSFGAWISMQLMMRRPEINHFISVAPPASSQDFSFLAPCPASGCILHGTTDQVVPAEAVEDLTQKLMEQKNIEIDYRAIEGADHYFLNQIDLLERDVNDYLGKVLASVP